eukprot:CAMPEP_0198242012 /NCGR_PEP_ID=MMETSP1446-20131203/8637_1 /TAXON_ID=1461542 ORGANISM="Unidentified sp, Strain CCMP2111" /NCGR_SAMPLE_ID=MMETSP1446 /ASSEMBLY_ACC=CAM_ASM_001112 /LENGTH=534 /DNA_ID=CAMNT_0043925109 /DNA_START=320 /DNA_END=1924 /DNA_ORIENTATION=+
MAESGNRAKRLDDVSLENGREVVSEGENESRDNLLASVHQPSVRPDCGTSRDREEGLNAFLKKAKLGLPRGSFCPLGAYSTGSPWTGSLEDAKSSCSAMLFGTKLNILLVCVPLAAFAHYKTWGSGIAAMLAMVSLCPLAERLGFVTEQLALRTNDTLGALLNVTFGNATELIFSIVALKQSQIRLIQLSLIGSVLSNGLLVLGSAMVIGGLKHRTQLLDKPSTIIHLVLLLGSAVAVIVPTAMGVAGSQQDSVENLNKGASLLLSRIVSIFMAIAYGLFLYHTLMTNKRDEIFQEYAFRSTLGSLGSPGTKKHNFYASQADVELGQVDSLHRKSLDEPMPCTEMNGNGSIPDTNATDSVNGEAGVEEGEEEEDEEDEEEIYLTTCSGVIWLGVIAVTISWLSDILVDEIEKGAAEQLHLPSTFLYTIIIPIVGNAAEHTSAFIFAYKNKPNISFGIAVGSSIQVALLVMPVCVLMGWIMHQELDLTYSTFECAVYTAAVLLLFAVLHDGRSNWLKGSLLLIAYLMIGIGFWFV